MPGLWESRLVKLVNMLEMLVSKQGLLENKPDLLVNRQGLSESMLDWWGCKPVK